MPAEQIARNLAFINWTVLSSLAIGAFAAVVIGRFATPATKGFLAFTCACAAMLGLLAWLSDGGITSAGPQLPIVDPTLAAARGALLLVFTVTAGLYAIVLARNGRGPLLAVIGLGAGLGALVAGAVGWSHTLIGAVPLAIQLVLLAAASGGVFAAMILGHWYLVTPKLPEAPLVLFARLLLGVVALQLVLFLVWMTTGAGAGRAPFEPLVGQWAFFVWMRLLIGIVFPLVVSWAAIQTARTRSMESATGLLYIDVGAIAAGTILAAGLYFGAGLLA